MNNNYRELIKCCLDSYDYKKIARIFNINTLEAMYIVTDYNMAKSDNKDNTFELYFNYLLNILQENGKQR